MDREALALAFYLVFVAAIPVVVVWLSFRLGPRRFEPGKLTPYECGVPLLQDLPDVIRVRFYLVAILFLLFDVEAALLIGWAVVHRSLGATPAYGLIMFLEVVFFLALLALGLLYGIKKGALRWDPRAA